MKAEEWYKKKCEELEEKSRNTQTELEKVNMEINEYRKQVTQLEMELESLRGTNDYLERNLAGTFVVEDLLLKIFRYGEAIRNRNQQLPAAG